MNLFLANSLNISIQLLFAVLVIVSLLLLGVVLMQRPKQEGLGAAFGFRHHGPGPSARGLRMC